MTEPRRSSRSPPFLPASGSADAIITSELRRTSGWVCDWDEVEPGGGRAHSSTSTPRCTPQTPNIADIAHLCVPNAFFRVYTTDVFARRLYLLRTATRFVRRSLRAYVSNVRTKRVTNRDLVMRRCALVVVVLRRRRRTPDGGTRRPYAVFH